jgi:DNA-binding Lrp family transcriptional regulator
MIDKTSFISEYFDLIFIKMARNKNIHIEPSTAKMDKNNDTINHTSKQILKLLDSTNFKIISELVAQPNTSSLTLSKKLDIPLSTLQRRRARIENAILNRKYTFNYKAFGGRMGDLIISIDKGKSREVAQTLLKKYKNNIVSCNTRINSEHNVSAHTVFKDTQELYELVESIKSLDYVNGVQWSELVEDLGDNNFEVMSAFFGS